MSRLAGHVGARPDNVGELVGDRALHCRAEGALDRGLERLRGDPLGRRRREPEAGADRERVALAVGRACRQRLRDLGHELGPRQPPAVGVVEQVRAGRVQQLPRLGLVCECRVHGANVVEGVESCGATLAGAAAVPARLRVDRYPGATADDGDCLWTAADRDRRDRFVGRRIDPRHGPVAAVGDPYRAGADGHTMAFTSPTGGTFQLYVMLTSGGEPLQLTSDEGDKLVAAFSADGTEIYYSRLLGHSDIWAVPTLGGNPRHVVSASLFTPSTDGKWLYYIPEGSRAIYRSEPSGLGGREVFKFDDADLSVGGILPYRSEDELFVLTASLNEGVSHAKDVHLANRTASDLGTLPIDPSDVLDIAWEQPGKSVIFSRTENGIKNIWRYDLRDRGLSQVTYGAGPDADPMADPAGKGIYYISGKSSGFLTAYKTRTKESVDIVDEDASQPSISPDGKRVMYIAMAGPHRNEIWISDIDGKNKVKVASTPSLTADLWSHDGSQLSFTDFTSAPYKIYVAGADGSNVRQVPWNGEYAISFLFGSDGKTFYASSIKTGQSRPQTWKINSDGSDTRMIADGCGQVWDESWDGKYLIGMEANGEGLGIYELSVADNKCTKLVSNVSTLGILFAPDDKSFLYAVAARGFATIYRQPWSDGKLTGPAQVAFKVPFAFSINYANGNGYDFSRDLSTIVYVRPGGQQDVYLLTQK